MTPDVVDMILQDHREQERVLRDLLYHPCKRRGLVPVMVALLASHCRAEETVVYPILADVGHDGLTEQCQAEHLASDRLLDALMATPTGDDFEGYLRSLTDVVTWHHEREELQLLPHLRERLDPEQLDELTDIFAERRARLLIGEVGYASRRVLQQQAANAGIRKPESLPLFQLEEALARASTAGMRVMYDERDDDDRERVAQIPVQWSR